MALEPIRPKDLPAAATVYAADSIPTDDGVTVNRATPSQLVDAGAPVPSEATAIAGIDNVSRMTPFLTRAVLNNEIAPAVLLAQAWAESPTPPIPGSESSKTWAGQAAVFRDQAAISAAQAALYDGPRVDTFAQLVALTAVDVAVGQYVQVRSLAGQWYRRVASGGMIGPASTVVAVLDFDVVPLAGWVWPLQAFGAVAGADVTVAFQKAIDVAKIMRGGTILMQAGDFTISTTLNLNDYNLTAPTNIPANHLSRITVQGAGSGSSRLLGGEIGYGFIEFIGSNYLNFQGFTILADRSVNQAQFGLLGGRKTGNASCGNHTFRDVFILGSFTKAAGFFLSSEINIWRDSLFYPQIGHGLVMAMNNSPWAVTPRWGTFGTGLGGNGDNQLENVQFLSAGAAASTDVLLAMEYAQSFHLKSCYFASTTNTAQIMLRKSGSGTFENCFHEGYGSFDPISIWFAPEDPLDPNDYIDYRDIHVVGGRLLWIRAEDTIRVTNMTLDNVVFRGVKAGTTWHIDMAKLFDSSIKYSNRLANVTLVTDLKVRAREEADGNTFAGINIDSISLPTPSLNAFWQSVNEDIGDLTPVTETQMNTVPGAAVANSGMYAQLAAGNVPGVANFGLFVDFDCPALIDGNIRGVIGLGGSATNLGSAHSLLVYVFNGNLFFRTMGPTGATENTYRLVDASFIPKFLGKRVRLLLVRNGAVPLVYINGYACQVVQSVSSARAWTDTINGPFVLMGFSSTGTTSLCSTSYYSAGLLNYAPTAAQARRITRRGIPQSDKWGGNFGGAQGCNGFWRPGLGRGAVYDESGQAATGVVTGTVTRLNPRAEIIQLFGSAAYDPPSLADGAGVTTTVTVTGAALGDYVDASFGLDLQGITLAAYISAADTGAVRFQNESGGVLDLASASLDLRVVKR